MSDFGIHVDLVNIERERDQLRERLAAAETQLERIVRENVDLVEERNDLKAQLEHYRTHIELTEQATDAGRAIMEELAALRRICKLCEACGGTGGLGHYEVDATGVKTELSCDYCNGLGAVVREER